MKKGFTLVEIILSIALITVVGVGSIIGFITYKNYTKEKTLNEMDSEILTALRVYMETNEEIKSKVYEEKEGLAVSLQTLQNEGLIDFGNLDITDEDDYVVAFLTAENDCSDISTLKGWDFQDGKPLYICTNSSGGQNLFQVAGAADNLSQGTREKYWFKGQGAANFIQFNGTGTRYRIMYVDKDDSLVLYHTTTFNNVFNGLTLPISNTGGTSSSTIWCSEALKSPIVLDNSIGYTYYPGGEATIDSTDAANISLCTMTTPTTSSMLKTDYYEDLLSSWINVYADYTSIVTPSVIRNYDGYKIHLKPCMKITSGTGDYANPYILENKCV